MSYAVYQGGHLTRGAGLYGQFMLAGAQAKADARAKLGTAIGGAIGTAAKAAMGAMAMSAGMSAADVSAAGGGFNALMQSRQQVPVDAKTASFMLERGAISQDMIAKDGTARVPFGKMQSWRRTLVDAKGMETLLELEGKVQDKQHSDDAISRMAPFLSEKVDASRYKFAKDRADLIAHVNSLLDQAGEGAPVAEDAINAVEALEAYDTDYPEYVSELEAAVKEGNAYPRAKGKAARLARSSRELSVSEKGVGTARVAELKDPYSTASLQSIGATTEEVGLLSRKSGNPSAAQNVQVMEARAAKYLKEAEDKSNPISERRARRRALLELRELRLRGGSLDAATQHSVRFGTNLNQ